MSRNKREGYYFGKHVTISYNYDESTNKFTCIKEFIKKHKRVKEREFSLREFYKWGK